MAGFLAVAARLGGGLMRASWLVVMPSPPVRGSRPAGGAVCGVPGSRSRLMGLRLGVQSRALGPAKGGSSAMGSGGSAAEEACSSSKAKAVSHWPAAH